MACNSCEEYQCLDVNLDMCSSGVELPIVADETGNWVVLIEFNGTWQRLLVEVTNTENVVIPNVLNEYYIHIIRLFNSAGELVNDTCYKLKTQLMDNGGSPFAGVSAAKEVYRVDFTVSGNPTTIGDLLNSRAELLKIDVEKMEIAGTLDNTTGEVTFTDAVADGQTGYILYKK